MAVQILSTRARGYWCHNIFFLRGGTFLTPSPLVVVRSGLCRRAKTRRSLKPVSRGAIHASRYCTKLVKLLLFTYILRMFSADDAPPDGVTLLDHRRRRLRSYCASAYTILSNPSVWCYSGCLTFYLSSGFRISKISAGTTANLSKSWEEA